MKLTATAVDRDVHATNHPREYRLFWALDDDGDSEVNKSDLVLVLERNGPVSYTHLRAHETS